MKKFKSTYAKVFNAEYKDAINIAMMLQPPNTELENVIEIEDTQFDLFSELEKMFNPNK
ncbi:MAG: hypothetical protein OEV44_00045 [Spirochaetota bacterium]|nr:hypothetical protein [Spirochaetota bacterium]